MSLTDLLPIEEWTAVVGVAAVVVYALLGGADYGAGVWDLLASGPRRREQRAAIASAIGPVWEVNHIWLIFVIVLLFAAWPAAYAAVGVALYRPFHLVLVGVVLRGACFVFRHHAEDEHGDSLWGHLFGIASAWTPLLLGMCLGALSTGDLRVVDGVVVADPTGVWTSPLCWTMGVLALLLTVYLAAVYLCVETRGALREDFRRRALLGAGSVVLAGTAALFVLERHAPHLWDALSSGHGVVVLAVGMLLGLLAPWALLTRRFGLARLFAAGEVSALVLGWALAQRPFVVYPDITVFDAAPAPTLRFLLVAIPIGALLLVPSLLLLLAVFKGGDASAEDEPRDAA